MAGEPGEPIEGQVDLHGARACPPAFDGGHEVWREVGGVQVAQEGDLGWVVAMTTEDRSSSPDSNVAPVTRPLATSMRATGGVRAHLGAELASRPHAARRTPRPYRLPGSPTRPGVRRRRRRPPCGAPSRRRCPGERGPAQVPITPLTARIPLSCGLSKCSSRRSEMLEVNSRVRSPAILTSTPRSRHPRRDRSSRSPGRFEPTFGGTWDSRGPRTSAMPASQVSHSSMASASRGGELRDLLVPQPPDRRGAAGGGHRHRARSTGPGDAPCSRDAPAPARGRWWEA